MDQLDYGFVADLVGDEAIVGTPSVTALPSDLTIGAVTVAVATLAVWIEGGAHGSVYVITCVVSTSGGRTIIGRAALFVGPDGLDDATAIAPES